MARFVLELSFAPADERRLEVRPQHRGYLSTLLAEGTLVSAGPWADDTGAMILLDVANEAAAREIIAADPYTDAGVVTVASLREWRPILP